MTGNNMNRAPQPIEPVIHPTPYEFGIVHDILVRTSQSDGLTDEQRAVIADDLNRFCEAHPESYAAYMEQQRQDYETSLTRSDTGYGA